MNTDSSYPKWLYCLGLIPTIWLALLIAPSVNGGLPQIMKDFSDVIGNPFHITWCDSSIKVIIIFIIGYVMAITIYLSTKKNYRRREEHGSARWENANEINKKYKQLPMDRNKLLTQNVCIGLNGKKHRRNLNVLVCGGSGAGKTRFYCKPNVMQCNTSMVILDPKGEIVRDTGKLLKKKGYEVKVLDLINMEKSHCYNPFVYLKNDNDVQKLVTNLFKSTTPKGSQSNDPFWDTAASMLLLALVFYLKYEAPEDEQNFPMVMELLRAGEVHEDDDSYVSPLDVLFNRLEEREPEHIAVKYYRDYHSGSAKTLKSIQITLAARLEKFNLESLASLTATDELDLGKQLLPIGMLVVLDSILNRITTNRSKGRNTFIFIDEIYLLFQHEYSANFLFTLWKRVRKYGAYCTGITQNVDDLLQSHTARTMLANSEFIVMLNQASTDRLELAKLLNISELQMGYITNVGAGQGLLKVGSSLVPFINKFPTNTKLYKLMTTKPGEGN